MSDGDNLFSNPMTKSALNAMTDEQKEHYQKIGEEMYGTVDFEDSKILDNAPTPMAEAAAYVVEGLKSGLHPSYLDENEVVLMTDLYGEKWYEKWEATEEDMKKTFTFGKK